jgi:hypothetical protein
VYTTHFGKAAGVQVCQHMLVLQSASDTCVNKAAAVVPAQTTGDEPVWRQLLQYCLTHHKNTKLVCQAAAALAE